MRYAPAAASNFFPFTLFISIYNYLVSNSLYRSLIAWTKLTNKEHRNANPPTAMGKINALVTASLYANKTPPSCPSGATCLTPVAPAAIIIAGSTPLVCCGSCVTSVFEKIFCATETDSAPPSVLKKIANALPVGISFALNTTCTAMNGIWTDAPAPIPVRSWYPIQAPA